MELLYYVTLLSCLLLLTSQAGARCAQPRGGVECTQWRHIFTLDVILSDVQLETKAASLLQCGQTCSARTWCQSFGFHEQSRRCLLYPHLVEHDCAAPSGRGTRYYWPRGKSCPQNYTQGEGMCWRWKIQSVAWNEARNVCRSEGAHLYIADSPYSLDLIRNVSMVWLGARRLCSGDVFRWVNGLGIKDSQFYPEPSQEALKCVLKQSAGTKFIDTACHNRYNFVCQVPQ